MKRRKDLRRPRTTGERREACGAEADRDEGVPRVRTRFRPTSYSDIVVAALYDRTRRIPPHLRRTPRLS
jgi:hypothetical protein